ncbi:HNH endonuclease [Arthrobacter sp. 8AJ]|nr:HNH endonuclease [Arthrobacter sp. 8AJ]
MEAIGEHLGAAYGGKAYDAGSWLPRPAHLHAVPGEASQHRATGPAHQDLLAGMAVRIAAIAVAAPDVLASASYLEAAEFAARAEDLARSVEYLQLLGAGAVDRTRTQATTDAAATTRAARSAAMVETDANWPNPPAGPGHPVVSPADDGCRNTAEFLRLRLHIPIREARRRLALAHHVLPATSLTGEPLPPARPHLAAAITPTTTGATDTDSDTGITSPGYGPAVSSHAAAIITATLDRLQHHTTAETLDAIEHHLTTTATTTDPDFLTRLAQRWTDTIDADGSEPTEEALRHTQGAFIRKPRHGLHHLEIFATTDQYEHLLTVMNTATNPRTTTGTATSPASRGSSGNPGRPGSSETPAANHTAEQGISEHTPLPDLDRRTRAQKQLDGLITAAKTALATNTLPITGGNRPHIIATINYEDLFPTNPVTPATSAGKDHSVETGTGTFAFTGPVPAATLRKIACDADIIPALLGTTGEILDLGRKTRLFTPAQRTALTARDQGCAFPKLHHPRTLVRSPPHHLLVPRRAHHHQQRRPALQPPPPPRPQRTMDHHHHPRHSSPNTPTKPLLQTTPPPHPPREECPKTVR